MNIDFTPKSSDVKKKDPKSYLILKGKEKETLEKIKNQLNYSWAELLSKMIDLLVWYLNQQNKAKAEENEKEKEKKDKK